MDYYLFLATKEVILLEGDIESGLGGAIDKAIYELLRFAQKRNSWDSFTAESFFQESGIQGIDFDQLIRHSLLFRDLKGTLYFTFEFKYFVKFDRLFRREAKAA